MKRLPPGFLGLLAAALLAASPVHGQEQVWLELDPAGAATLAGPVGLAEVTGFAAAGAARGHDVVLVLDVSGSTLLPSGADLDGDGRVGRRLRSADDPLRSFNPRRLCSDPEDSVRAAEIAAARRFAGALDPEHSRVALVVFAESAQLRAPLGSTPAALDAALGQLAADAAFGWGATDLAAALAAARKALAADSAGNRQRSIVVLSDGSPNHPGGPRRASREALAEARRAAAGGARIHAFALGAEVMEETDVYRRLAEETGGRFAWVERPGDVVPRLAELELAPVGDVEVENASTGEAGRAVRVSPDGRFDGWVPLAAGDNRIRVTARGLAGGEASAERVVRFEPQEPRTPEEARAAEETLARLRERSVGLELGLRAGRGADAMRRLELEAEASPPSRPDVAAPPP